MNNRGKKTFSVFQKIQLALAMVVTCCILVVPAYGWFHNQNDMAVSTKVNSPAILEIKAGGRRGQEQAVINFELTDIDTENKDGPWYMEGDVKWYYKDFVFCVKGKAISAYDLQLAHTTNIPFKYEIIPAIQDDSGDIVYVSKDKTVVQNYKLARVKLNGDAVVLDTNDQIIYEDSSEPLDGKYVNNAYSSNDRVIAKDNGDSSTAKDLTDRSYNTSSDQYQAYANPVYWLKRGIPVYTEEKGDDGFTHSYVLRVSWIMHENVSENDLSVVQNNKETDIVYITAAIN